MTAFEVYWQALRARLAALRTPHGLFWRIRTTTSQ